MGSVLYLRNADFSANAVGKVSTKTNITGLFSQQTQIIQYDGRLGDGGAVWDGMKSSLFSPTENSYLEIVVCFYRIAPSGDNWGPYAGIGFFDENDTLLGVYHFDASSNGVPGNYVQRYRIPTGTKYVLSSYFKSSYQEQYPSGVFLPFSAFLFEESE